VGRVRRGLWHSGGDYTGKRASVAVALLAAQGAFAHTAEMDPSGRRFLIVTAAMIAAALVFAFAVPAFASDRGVAGPTLAAASRPVLAGGALLLAYTLSTGFGSIAGRAANAVVGLFVVGAGVAILSMRSGTVKDLVFGEAQLRLVTLEALGWTALVAVASAAIFRFAGPLSDVPKTFEDDIDSPTGRSARISWLAGIAGVVAVWLAAATLTKGQALGAATLGGFAAGAIGRLLAPRTQPVYLAAAPMAVFTAAYGFLAFTLEGNLATGLVDGSLPRLLRVMPVDMAAGALMGTALGYGFMRSFVEQKAAQPGFQKRA
jgi:hypothetical protein